MLISGADRQAYERRNDVQEGLDFLPFCGSSPYGGAPVFISHIRATEKRRQRTSSESGLIKFPFIQWQHGYTHHIRFSSLELVRSLPTLLAVGDVESSLDLHVGPFLVPWVSWDLPLGISLLLPTRTEQIMCRQVSISQEVVERNSGHWHHWSKAEDGGKDPCSCSIGVC